MTNLMTFKCLHFKCWVLFKEPSKPLLGAEAWAGGGAADGEGPARCCPSGAGPPAGENHRFPRSQDGGRVRGLLPRWPLPAVPQGPQASFSLAEALLRPALAPGTSCPCPSLSNPLIHTKGWWAACYGRGGDVHFN